MNERRKEKEKRERERKKKEKKSRIGNLIMGLRKVPLHLCSEKETNTFFYKLADTYNQYYY